MEYNRDYATVLRAGRRPFKDLYRKQQESGITVSICLFLASLIITAAVFL